MEMMGFEPTASTLRTVPLTRDFQKKVLVEAMYLPQSPSQTLLFHLDKDT